MGWKPTTVLSVERLCKRQMQLQTIVCYGYMYDCIFITKFLKSNMNYTASRSAPNPQWKILDMQLVGHRATSDHEKLTLLLNYGQKISKHVQFPNVYNM